MRTWKVAVVLVVIATGCSSSRDGAPTPERAAAVDRQVQEFAATVAHDVTQDGPAAWRKHFSDGPEFYMATDGKLQFADSAAATAGIQNLQRMIKRIELKWSDVRVDPLTPELAGFRAAWHEVVDMADGKRIESGGYFTGTVEHRNGRWQIRNAHWSTASAAPGIL
jgi:hypothetical protein